jgi:hypothetical protein
MPTLTLDESDGAELREILQSYLSDLRMEIAGTDSQDFREGLKKREVFLKRLLRDLRTPARVSPPSSRGGRS